MIIELCKGGPHDGLKFGVEGTIMPLEWRAPSRSWRDKEAVYRLRSTGPETFSVTTVDVQDVKFDFVGYENALTNKE